MVFKFYPSFFSFPDVPASGMYFMTYEVISKKLKPADEEQSFSKKLLVTIPAGGMAGILNWVVAMPADVLKSRLQTGKPTFDVIFPSR